MFKGSGISPGETWDGLILEGDNSSLSHVKISDADYGLEVRAKNVTLDYLTLNGSGLLTDYTPDDCPVGQICTAAQERSSITLTHSSITSNSSFNATTGHGLVLRNTNATVTDTEISDNDGHGVVVWNADVPHFQRNTITDNGKDGIYVLSDGAIVLAEPSQDFAQGTPVYGRNRISGNGDDQLSVVQGGQLFAGISVYSQNTIEVGNTSPSRVAGADLGQRSAPNYPYLIENNSGSKVFARNNYWGSTTGPVATDFKGVVDAHPFYTSDQIPAGSSVQKSGPTPLVQVRGDLDWLGESIRTVRVELVAAPDSSAAPDLVRLLYGLQRLDGEDEQGEHAQTMAAIADRRAALDDTNASAALRATGEAALGAEVSEALLQEVYDDASGLLVEYNPEVHSEEERLTLILSAVSVLEQAGQYGSALARIADAQALLGPEDEELREELDWIAEIIAARAVDSTNGRGEGGQAASKQGETTSSVASRTGSASVPAEYALQAAYPNPTSRGATVPFDLPEPAEVRVVVYDLLGREVAVLAEGLHEAGRHKAEFEASRLSSGVYVIRAEIAPTAGAMRAFTQKLTLVR